MLNDPQVLDATMVPEIFVASKVGESFGTVFLPSSLDATVMEDLLEVEKSFGYKPKTEVGEHFMHCMQQYMKEKTSIFHS